jgi:hypothetical protein
MIRFNFLIDLLSMNRARENVRADEYVVLTRYSLDTSEYHTINFVWTILDNSNRLGPVHCNTIYDWCTSVTHKLISSFIFPIVIGRQLWI